MQAFQTSALAARFSSCFPSSRIETAAEKHQAGNWYVTALSC